MAHLIDMSTGLPAIAFTGETPWHGLGYKIQPGAPIEEWQIAAGLNWEVKTSPVEWKTEEGEVLRSAGRFVLYRSDTKRLLNVASEKYNVVQPHDILEFYRDLIRDSLFELSTAGSLKDGGKIWAMAKAKRQIRICGNDVLEPYLLLASSTDGTMSTTGKFCNERVVCHNTLTMALGEAAKQVRVPHHSVFDPVKMKTKLGIIETMSETFEKQATKMAGIRLKKDDAIRFFVDLFCEEDEDTDMVDLAGPTQAKIGQLYYLYKNAPGHDLRSADSTLWGAVNAVTRFVDYVTPAKSQDNRLNSAWFGTGDKLKSKAYDAALKMAA